MQIHLECLVLLVRALADRGGSLVFALDKELGETILPGIEPPPWAWPKR